MGVSLAPFWRPYRRAGPCHQVGGSRGLSPTLSSLSLVKNRRPCPLGRANCHSSSSSTYQYFLPLKMTGFGKRPARTSLQSVVREVQPRTFIASLVESIFFRAMVASVRLGQRKLFYRQPRPSVSGSIRGTNSHPLGYCMVQWHTVCRKLSDYAFSLTTFSPSWLHWARFQGLSSHLALKPHFISRATNSAGGVWPVNHISL